jgi:1-acyl-sn-glycerol-3-phosphate acyltransferase
VIAAQHGIDIVPIYLDGTHEAMPPGINWPRRKPGRLLSRRHKVEVRFGDPIKTGGDRTPREVMDEVRRFWERKGHPAPPPAEPKQPVLVDRRPIVSRERSPEPVAEQRVSPVA